MRRPGTTHAAAKLAVCIAIGGSPDLSLKRLEAGVSASPTELQAAEVFSELTPEPVASASLGQVYRGRLISTGQQVAVKVQRPRIGESIAMDMLLLRRLMAAVDRYLPQVRWLFSHARCYCNAGGATSCLLFVVVHEAADAALGCSGLYMCE